MSWKCRHFLRNGKVASRKGTGLPPDSPTDQIIGSFPQLFGWFLDRGVRPSGRPDLVGDLWTNALFAKRAGLDERTIRNWRTGRSLPSDTDLGGIETILFGDNPAYADWRIWLRNAHRIAKKPTTPQPIPRPTKLSQISNITIRLPRHFFGREAHITSLEAALEPDGSTAVVTALHGLRGVGKTVLAAAYAESHRDRYRVTWWIKAQGESSTRADLAALGRRLGWVGVDEKEAPALAAVMERLSHEGAGILLIYDNALNAEAIKSYLPRGGATRVLITSNAHAWRGIAQPVEIRVWPKAVGADYLIARTGREAERAAAEEFVGGARGPAARS